MEVPYFEDQVFLHIYRAQAVNDSFLYALGMLFEMADVTTSKYTLVYVTW